MPIIILSGVLLGLFTPTEAAAVAVVYGFMIAKFVYRELSWTHFLRVLIESGVTTGIVMLIIGTATLFGWILTSQQIPHQISESLASISSEAWVFLLLVNIVFIIVHCVFEVSASLIMTLPILFPIARAYGIDPVHFGIVLTANMGVGMITPPIGMCLCVACGISGVSIQKATLPLLPLLGTMILALGFITFIPDFTLLLPRLIIGYQSP
jgi:C4-dicarboxylate transporter DctM subunit